MFNKTTLSAALTAALAASSPAFAETTVGGDSKTLAAVQVTGSNIKRTETEGANPVQVISQEQIAESGKLTVADLLRSISANTGNSTNETTNNGWSSGAAGIGLRGLSTKNTLILLNGRRLANYGFPNGGLSDTFVNLNALPLVAVERIEVLKDGASAVYGSDAVAGVVNIITRQSFEGAEIWAAASAARARATWTRRRSSSSAASAIWTRMATTSWSRWRATTATAWTTASAASPPRATTATCPAEPAAAGRPRARASWSAACRSVPRCRRQLPGRYRAHRQRADRRPCRRYLRLQPQRLQHPDSLDQALAGLRQRHLPPQ
jgi:Outer membrane receptor for ferrienterochelin and colicins